MNNPTAAKLDQLSGNFFVVGFAASKLKSLPFRLVSAFLILASLLCYLVGYSAWFIATLFYPRMPRKEGFWYGFAAIKDQYQIASLLGLVATTICLMAPSYLLPAAWIFTGSNILWGIAELHKQNNPPAYEDNFSSERQALYIKYTKLITVISVLTASCITLGVIYPTISTTALIFSEVVGNGLTIVALWYWKKAVFGDFPPDPKPTVDHSYQSMTSSMGATLANQSEYRLGLREEEHPNQYNNLFPSAANITSPSSAKSCLSI